MISVKVDSENSELYHKIDNLLLNVFQDDYEAKLVRRIRDSKHYVPDLALTAMIGTQLVGYALFSEIKIKSHNIRATSLALGPMAVANNFQKKGVGTQLMMHGLDRATSLGYSSVILLGHHDYYPRFGFEPTTTWEIEPPFDVKKESFMGIELVPNGLTKFPGIVEYPKVWEL